MSVTRPSGRIDPATIERDGYLLQSEADLADASARAVDRARALGAEHAVASANEDGGYKVEVANSEVETASRDGAQALTITVYEGGRTGTAVTQALDAAAVDRAVQQAIAIARQLQPDPEAGLADPDTLAWDTPSPPTFAPSGQSATDLADAALEAERGAGENGADVRVVQAGAASRDSRWALATSHGFCRTGSSSIQQRWCVTIAERDGVMTQDYWSSTDRRLEGLMSNADIGLRAAERTLAKLGARDLETQRANVLFDATVATSLVFDLCQALVGGAQFRRATFLPDALGKQAAASHIQLLEDPFEAFGLASAAYDGEGVATARRKVLDDGCVAGLFLGTRMGRKLGMRSTGHASGFHNLTLASNQTADDDDLPAMLRKMGRGLWLTQVLGGGVNPVTGAFSKAAIGFWIENGVVAGPVQNFTVAGSLPDMLREVVAVGADVHREGAVRTGSILIENLQIAGR